jgi:hypothetical protein
MTIETSGEFYGVEGIMLFRVYLQVSKALFWTVRLFDLAGFASTHTFPGACHNSTVL